jgi:outer membrane protein OmpA-like peptidoglycan-associated protein
MNGADPQAMPMVYNAAHRDCRRTRPAHGATMTEFIVVAPVLLLIGLALLQYTLLFVAKNQVNHAAFMATRTGSMQNATVESISQAYLRHLAPLYGGGGNPAEVAQAVARATADMQGNYRIELINPNRASFDDFNDPALKEMLKTDARVIPNSSLALRNPAIIGRQSGQNIFDANLIKIRITHGYKPGVLLVGRIFAKALEAAQEASENKDDFAGRLIAAGRVPITTDITLHMNSPAIEWADPVWISAGGPQASPKPPADPPTPPGGSSPTGSADAGNGGNGGASQDNSGNANAPTNTSDGTGGNNAGTQDTTNECGGKACPVCPVDPANGEPYSLSADTLFDFDSAVLKTNGLAQLDTLIDEVKAAQKDGQTIQSATVTGYTDQLGSEALNLKLSQARAEAVRDYMKRRGFPDVPITVKGKGATDPVVPMESCGGTTEQKIACLAPNRRVMVDIKRSASQP